MSDSKVTVGSVVNSVVPQYTLDATLKRARIDNGDGTYSLRTNTVLNTESIAVDLTPVTSKQDTIIAKLDSIINLLQQ